MAPLGQLRRGTHASAWEQAHEAEAAALHPAPALPREVALPRRCCGPRYLRPFNLPQKQRLSVSWQCMIWLRRNALSQVPTPLSNTLNANQFSSRILCCFDCWSSYM